MRCDLAAHCFVGITIFLTLLGHRYQDTDLLQGSILKSRMARARAVGHYTAEADGGSVVIIYKWGL